MGKRSSFPRRPMDDYETPEAAVIPLLPFLNGSKTYAEPCAGRGKLIGHLAKHGMRCVLACETRTDLKAMNGYKVLYSIDALSLTRTDLAKADIICTNPPWTRELLHPLIWHFMKLKPTWLLFDADWAHTQQARPLIVHCEKIVSVGRVQWMEGSGATGLDNAAWFLFDARSIGLPVFHPRMA